MEAYPKPLCMFVCSRTPLSTLIADNGCEDKMTFGGDSHDDGHDANETRTDKRG